MRMSKLDRLLALLHALAESAEGLTLDEMAARIEVNRRTAERMRDVLMTHFDLEPISDGRMKRWRIVGRLGRVFTLPTASELAALSTEADGRDALGHSAQANLLSSLLTKINGAMDSRARNRIAPDFEALVALQRVMLPAGPAVPVPPETMAAVHSAIMRGCLLEFDYQADGLDQAEWRRVNPYGLIHGATSYLVAAMPKGPDQPVLWRLDRMSNLNASDSAGGIPDDFDLNAWLAQSFGIWREAIHDVELRILPPAMERARNWRFHPNQSSAEDDAGGLIVRFRAGGLRELAEHLFTWGETVQVIGPAELKNKLIAMLEAALSHHQQ